VKALDAVNCMFESGGALLLCMNIRRLLRDKQVQGVSIVPVMWWNLWGFWNVYYYHSLEQNASFWAGLGVLTANTIWVFLALYYRFTRFRRV